MTKYFLTLKHCNLLKSRMIRYNNVWWLNNDKLTPSVHDPTNSNDDRSDRQNVKQCNVFVEKLRVVKIIIDCVSLAMIVRNHSRPLHDRRHIFEIRMFYSGMRRSLRGSFKLILLCNFLRFDFLTRRG